MDYPVNRLRQLLMSWRFFMLAIILASTVQCVHSSPIATATEAMKTKPKHNEKTTEETLSKMPANVLQKTRHISASSELETPTKRISTTNRRVRREVDTVKLWENGIIPYAINYNFSIHERALLQAAMETYQQYTCLRFRNASDEDRDYVNIVHSSRCVSNMGKVGGAQEFQLNAQCHMGTIRVFLHQLGHVIGLPHEQSRPDRDKYVLVNDFNVHPDYLPNLYRASAPTADANDTPYSYLSIMHDSIKAFSSNGKPTIIPRTMKYLYHMGRLDQLTFEDVKLINAMYNCSGQSPNFPERGIRHVCTGEGFIGPGGDCLCASTNDSVVAAPCTEQLKLCSAAKTVTPTLQLIQSPGFPRNYPNRLHCTWVLEVLSGGLLLNFTSFSTEESFDKVTIDDISGYREELSGTKDPFTRRLTARTKIEFITDDLATSTGFQILIESLADVTSDEHIPKSHSERGILPFYTDVSNPTSPWRFPTPHRCGAAVSTIQLPVSCFDVALTEEGRLLLRTWLGSLLEFSINGEQLSRFEPGNLSYYYRDFLNDVVALDGGGVAVSLNKADMILTLKRRDEKENTTIATWIEEQRFQYPHFTPVSLAAHKDVLAMTVIRRGEYPSSIEEGRQLALMNLTDRKRVKYLSRDYDIASVALTADAIVTVGRSNLKCGSKGDVVDAYSISNSNEQLWRYEVSSDEERVEDICAENYFSDGILYAAILKRDRSSGRVAAISLKNGKELLFDVLNSDSHLRPHSIALGFVNGQRFLAVLGWNINSNLFSTLTLHPLEKNE